jgi:anti-sigma B factor antagonist
VFSRKSDKIEEAGINIIPSRSGALACLKGRIDIDSSPALRDRLLALLQAPHPSTVRIDFSSVTHMDSSGLATLIEALKVARGCQTELRLEGLHDRLYQLFESTGILSLFNENTAR